MKSIFASNKKKSDSKKGFVALTEKQMLQVRGGGRPPMSPKPIDDIDWDRN